MKKITLLLFAIFTFSLGFSQGQDCTNPIVIGALPYNTTDDTSNYGNNYAAADRPALGGEQVANGTGSDSYLNGDDAVYSFTPAADGVFSFELSGTPSDWISFWLFEGCPFTSIVGRHTATSGTTRSLPNLNLTAGTTYYVVISTWPAPQSTAYTLDVTEVVPAVPNCDASLTTTTSVPIAGDISWIAATGSPAVTSYDLTVGSTSGASDVLATTDVGNVLTYNLGALPYSTTYYVNLVPKNGIGPATGCTEQTFVTAPAPPANDDCAAAVGLIVNTDFACGTVASSTLAGATASAEDAAACSGTENDDVWFSFMATTSSHRISLLNIAGSPTDLYHSLWEGSCGGLTLVSGSCSDGNTSNPSGLTSGNTYFVRVNSWSSNSGATSTFDICIGTPPPPPANDDCSGAIALIPGATFASNPIDGTVASATSGTEPAAGCGADGPGVWYSVVVPADGNITIETGPDAATGDTGFDSLIEAFSGTCGALTSIECDDDDSTGLFSILELTGLTPNSTIFIRVWESGGNDDEPFSISAYNASLSVEDNKIDGFAIYPNPVNDILRFDAIDAIGSISIYNLLGQEVLRTQPKVSNTEVDMTSLPTGMYVVKVQVGEQLGSYRIIKE
ncbi:MAG: hypothetical protein COA67_01095 [Lutibacter sp.]|nr:MAG: hypothetical protein COA67_01095 [Lutibacter sp.]